MLCEDREVREQYGMCLENFPKSMEALEGVHFVERLKVSKTSFEFTDLGHLPLSLFSSYLIEKECCKCGGKYYKVWQR